MSYLDDFDDDDDLPSWRAQVTAGVRAQVSASFPRRAVEVATASDPVRIGDIARWPGGGIAVLSGSFGVGKTVGATWWAMHRRRRAPLFMRAAEFAWLPRYGDGAERRAELLQAPGLVLDDLDAESKPGFEADLDELVDAYYSRPRSSLLITTNLTAPAFRTRYGDRVFDRLREAGTWITITGSSLRRGTP